MTNVPFLNKITNELSKRKLKSDVVANAILDIAVDNDRLDNLLTLQSSASEIDGSSYFQINTLTVVGDSIASQNGGGDYDLVEKNQYAVGSINWFKFLSYHKLQLISNKGIGGERSDQILARIDDVLSTNANFYMYIIGKNDIVQLISANTIINNLKEIFDRTINSGGKVIATTIIPKETFVQGEVDRMEAVNNWIRSLSNTNKNIIVLDFYKAIANFNTATSRTGTIRDGVHPSVQGAYLLGKEMDSKISKLLPDVDFFNSYNAKTTEQLLLNPYLTLGTGTISSWTQNTPTAILNKILNNDGTTTAEYTCTPGANYLFQTVSSGFTVGDSIEALAEVEVDSLASNVDQFQIYIQCKNGSTLLSDCSFLQLATVESIRFPLIAGVKGLLKTPRMHIPEGTTSISYFIQFNITGKFRIGKCNLRKIIV